MYSQSSEICRGRILWICLWTGCLTVLTLVVGCLQSEEAQNTVPQGAVTQDAAVQELDLSRGEQYNVGDWTYTYSIINAATRSEGYHGVLLYKQIEMPAPMHINDYYETPWGKLYWVGRPVVLFGSHGWISKPLAREPIGQALIDPAIALSERFLVHLKILATEELATPDRLEKDPNVLAAIKPFGLPEAHVQRDWFPIGPDPIRLHDTKRWGMLTVCRADLNQRVAPTLEFTCTTDLTVETTPKPASLMELMPVPEFPNKPTRFSLSAQVDALQPIQCTLSPIVGDPLILYVLCRIEDQGPDRPWKSPSIRIYESEQPTPGPAQ